MFIGIAGPVDRARLLRMATKAGVAESARFLTGHTEWLLRLGTPTGYNPGRLLERTGATLADPASVVEGLHVFTFNPVRQTEQWRRSLLDRIAARLSGRPDSPGTEPSRRPWGARRPAAARPRSASRNRRGPAWAAPRGLRGVQQARGRRREGVPDLHAENAADLDLADRDVLGVQNLRQFLFC